MRSKSDVYDLLAFARDSRCRVSKYVLKIVLEAQADRGDPWVHVAFLLLRPSPLRSATFFLTMFGSTLTNTTNPGLLHKPRLPGPRTYTIDRLLPRSIRPAIRNLWWLELKQIKFAAIEELLHVFSNIRSLRSCRLREVTLESQTDPQFPQLSRQPRISSFEVRGCCDHLFLLKWLFIKPKELLQWDPDKTDYRSMDQTSVPFIMDVLSWTDFVNCPNLWRKSGFQHSFDRTRSNFAMRES